MIRRITPRSILGLLGLAAMLCVASPAEAQYELVSVSSAGVLSNGYSLLASTSADGRFVVFGSTATNLTTEQTSGLFLRNRVSRKTTKLVAPGFVRAATVSDDGRYVVWDNGGTAYRKDMDTGAVSTLQHPPSDSQHEPVVFGAMQMGDGRHVAYFGDARVRQSTVYYLLDGIFVRDMQTGEVCAAHTASDGTPGNQPINVATDETVPPSVSADGRFVVFFSIATNLLGTNGGLTGDGRAFLHDCGTGETRLISPIPDHVGPTISRSGSFIAIYSFSYPQQRRRLYVVGSRQGLWRHRPGFVADCGGARRLQRCRRHALGGGHGCARHPPSLSPESRVV